MCCSSVLLSQNEWIVVRKILLEGNKKTKARVILRELNFQEGDTLTMADLGDRLEWNRKMVMNTGLFVKAAVNIKNWETETNLADIQLQVQESWYLYPIPIFELADRNFNVWWVQQNRSLKRVNYGMYFVHSNLTGKRDRLKLIFQQGYTQKYTLDYQLPYLNQGQTLGSGFQVNYAQNKEVHIGNPDNKQAFFRADDVLLTRLQMKNNWVFRPHLYTTHEFYVSFIRNEVADHIARDINPDFFLYGRQSQRYFSTAYRFTHDRRDIKPYPMHGSMTTAELKKDGLGVFKEVNALAATVEHDHYFSFSPKLSSELIVKMRTSLLREKQPFYNNPRLGFGGDFIRGYEYYVIDGLDYGFVKSALRFSLWEKGLHFGKLMPVNAFKHMPVRVYMTAYQDLGFVNNPFLTGEGFLSNEVLWGGGVGLDFVFFFDKVFQIQYSFNRLQESGLFLHTRLSF